MQTSEVLNKAADLIEEKGWWHDGAEHVRPGATCAANAVSRIGQSIPERIESLSALVSYLGGVKCDLAVIWNWNDAPERTQSEVVEALRACAVIEAGKEHAGDLWASWAVPSHLRAVSA